MMKLTENYVEIEFQNVADIGERLIQGNRCLFITYREQDSLIKNAVNTIYFPNIKNMEQAITVLCEMQKKCLACREKEQFLNEKKRLLSEIQLNAGFQTKLASQFRHGRTWFAHAFYCAVQNGKSQDFSPQFLKKSLDFLLQDFKKKVLIYLMEMLQRKEEVCMKGKRLLDPALLLAAAVFLIFLTWQGGSLFGSSCDWFSQHVSIADTMRQTMREEGTLLIL